MLEHRNINFLKDCVRAYADGSHAVADCTLPALLRWGWNGVSFYKQIVDNMCKYHSLELSFN